MLVVEDIILVSMIPHYYDLCSESVVGTCCGVAHGGGLVLHALASKDVLACYVADMVEFPWLHEAYFGFAENDRDWRVVVGPHSLVAEEV